MTVDRSERRAYRRSPGRQYSYENDPLRGQNRNGQSQGGRSRPSVPGERQGQGTYEDAFGRGASRSGSHELQLSPRPNPRRTRQLLRQNILAGKSKTALYGEHEAELHGQQSSMDENLYERQEATPVYANRYPRRNRPLAVGAAVPRRSLDVETGQEDAEWEELAIVDPDMSEDPLEQRLRYSELPTNRPADRAVRYSEPPREYEEDEYAQQDDGLAVRRSARRSNVSRRKLLKGIGIVAVGGAVAAVAAYELPTIPKAINTATTGIEHQLGDSFNKGFSAGAESVRREFVTALDSLEGVSLDAATSAAMLTRTAYDVFVSPVLKILATVADDFLLITLRALITGRHWLSNIGQDNGTLGALQQVLETWDQRAKQLPKQLQATADTELDGAQTYLRLLKRKLDAERAKLNGESTTPTTKP